MKYMGSKNRIAKHIIPFLEKEFRENNCVLYVEPCVGGANMIDKITFTDRLFGYDINEYLIALFNELQGGYNPPFIEKDQYNDIRLNMDKYPKYLVGWVGICCSYSGKWFGGYAGKTDTKQGMRDYQKEAYNNVMKQLPNLSNVKFNHGDLFQLKLNEKSLIYCDIPYRDTTKYNDTFNHNNFYEWCLNMKNEGHIVMVSEYNMPENFECLWGMEVKSSLSANGISGGSKTSTEKLFILR